MNGFKIELEKDLNDTEIDVQDSINLEPETIDTDIPEEVITVSELIKADRVGIFYLNEDAGDSKFVQEGSQVKKGDPLCVIKAMKIKHVIKAESDLTIGKILVEEDKPVDFGKPLFEIA